MKIDRLDLIAYGSLTNVTLDLAGAGCGMVVVHGDNEAGKTTTLNAIRHWLFGFDHRAENLDFRHKASNLRVGGVLSNSDSTLASVRRKGRKDTLLAADGKSPLADHALATYLKAISPQQFVESFGLTHASLRDGGRQIADGEGDLGAALFAAASGVANLQKMRGEIGKRKDALFAPRASVPKINAALKAYADAKKAWDESMVKAAEAERLSADVGDKQKALAELRAAESRLRARLASLRRLLQARELVLRFAELEKEQRSLKNVVPLRPTFAADYAALMPELRQAERDLANVDQLIQQHDAEIAGIAVDESILAVADMVETLHAKLDDVDSLQTSSERTEQLIRDKEGEAKQVLRKLGLPLPVDVEDYKEALRLNDRETKLLKKLAKKHGELAISLQEAERGVLAQQSKLQKATLRRESLPAESRNESLQAAIDDASRFGDVDQRIDALRREIASLAPGIEAGLERLGCRRDFKEVPTIPVPGTEAVERQRQRLDETEREATELRRKRSETAADLAELEIQFAKQQTSESLPSEADLAAARLKRERGWELIRRAWLTDDFDKASVADFTDADASERSLAQHYADAVAAADGVADQLAAEADRVRARLEREAQVAKLRRQVAWLDTKETQAAAQLDSRRADWLALWAPTAITPGSPHEMLGWLRDWERVSGQISQLAEVERDLAQLDRVVAEQSDRLRHALEVAGESAAELARHASFRDLLACSKRVQKKHDQEAANRQKLEENIDDAADSLRSAESERDLKRHELDKWQSEWTAATARLVDAGIAALLPDQLDDVLGDIRDYFDKLDFRRTKMIDRKSRLEEVERWQAAAQTVAAHLGERDAFLASANPAPLVAIWHARVETTRNARTRLHDRAGQLAKHQQQRPALEAAHQESQLQLRRLLDDAQADDAEQLPSRIELADRLRDLDRRIEEEYHKPLRALAAPAGCTPDDIVAQVGEAQGRDLAAEIVDAEGELEEFDRRRETAARELGDAESQQTTLLKRRGGIDQREQMESALARLRDLVPDYAVLVLAEAVLARALERYRERNKSDLFESASRFFQKLTCHRYEGLELDQDDKDRPFIVGVRRAGDAAERVGVSGMSEGTCDQLFLALRLAHLEKHVRDHGPFPIIVDDILLTFDDERAGAALDCLADLSEKTQVLFFTHHRHLRDMASSERFAGRIGVLDLVRS